jgi:AraC-like DNA-binding protein
LVSAIELSDMGFAFHYQTSSSSLVETIWQTQSEHAGVFTSLATTQSEMVFTRHRGATTLVMRGPETKATIADCPEGAEFFGITFKLGVFIPDLPPTQLVDQHAILPAASNQSFWLADRTWAIPSFLEADDFIDRLVRQGLIRSEPVVDLILSNQLEASALTQRSLQRRFQQATGLSHRTVKHIERARKAMGLLETGIPIFDVIHDLGFVDQPHLTKTLKHLVGLTPGQISGVAWTHSVLTERELMLLRLSSS